MAVQSDSRGAISIRNVTKIYDPDGVNVMAVDDCSLEIAAGEVCMIVGPSGCGKTTLGESILKLNSHSKGEVNYSNKNIMKLEGNDLKQFISICLNLITIIC